MHVSFLAHSHACLWRGSGNKHALIHTYAHADATYTNMHALGQRATRPVAFDQAVVRLFHVSLIYIYI